MNESRNPFRVAEHVRDAYFTDRADEVAVVRRAMADRARLLVTGPRRMGKSTVMGVAADRVRADGGIVLAADLATASSLTEVSNRLLRAGRERSGSARFHRGGGRQGGDLRGCPRRYGLSRRNR